MPVAINGSGTITGVSVGGLPDGIVDTDMIAADAVTAAKVGTKTFTSYAIICDEKAADTNGGSFSASTWQTRDLNTEIADPDSIVSISSNQFTLGAGTYLIEAEATAKEVNRHILRIYNATSTSVVAYGMSAHASSGGSVTDTATVAARVTITGNTAFEIQHWGQSSRSDYGLGFANDASVVNKYTIVKIFKEA
jgi:hypothetical protein